MKRADILDKAKECVCGQREQDYGHPEDNFVRIANLWTSYKLVQFTPIDVAMMMALLKIARIQSGTGTDDSFIDLAGYAACGGEIMGRIRERQKEIDELKNAENEEDILTQREADEVLTRMYHANMDEQEKKYFVADISFDTRDDAEYVLSAMASMVNKYGYVSVCDYYNLSGFAYGDDIDCKYGWIGVATVQVVRTPGDSYMLQLPPAIDITGYKFNEKENENNETEC